MSIIYNITNKENKNENRNSFQDHIRQKTEVVAIPGKTNGSTTFLNIAKRP